MTKNEKKTDRTFKSEQHALMTATIALLKYTSEGYNTNSHYLPKNKFDKEDFARYEVNVHHAYGEDLQIAEYLEPSRIETRDYEPDGYREGFRATSLIYEYDY